MLWDVVGGRLIIWREHDWTVVIFVGTGREERCRCWSVEVLRTWEEAGTKVLLLER